jgi:hypothetical protein
MPGGSCRWRSSPRMGPARSAKAVSPPSSGRRPSVLSISGSGMAPANVRTRSSRSRVGSCAHRHVQIRVTTTWASCRLIHVQMARAGEQTLPPSLPTFMASSAIPNPSPSSTRRVSLDSAVRADMPAHSRIRRTLASGHWICWQNSDVAVADVRLCYDANRSLWVAAHAGTVLSS